MPQGFQRKAAKTIVEDAHQPWSFFNMQDTNFGKPSRYDTNPQPCKPELPQAKSPKPLKPETLHFENPNPFALTSSFQVLVVPGYGMAMARAQTLSCLDGLCGACTACVLRLSRLSGGNSGVGCFWLVGFWGFCGDG